MSVFEKQNILIIDGASSKKDLFKKIAKKAVEIGASEVEDAIIKGLKAREALGTTGFQDGFGIPHCRVPEITSAKIIYVKSESDVEWDSLDGNPLRQFFSLMIPDDRGDEHMKYLSLIARKLMNKDFRNSLKESSDVEEIYNLVNEGLK